MSEGEAPTNGDTASADYALRLETIQQVWWKRVLPVQAPYQWHLRRQRLGRTIEVGCGIGRNLASLAPGSVGIDHNAEAVALVKARGFRAYTPDAWQREGAAERGQFDGLLLSHVVEHMTSAQAIALLADYLVWLKPGGRVFIVCPQEVGYRSDATHVEFMDVAALRAITRAAGLRAVDAGSFPFPRWVGRLFIYNESWILAEKPAVRG